MQKSPVCSCWFFTNGMRSCDQTPSGTEWNMPPTHPKLSPSSPLPADPSLHPPLPRVTRSWLLCRRLALPVAVAQWNVQWATFSARRKVWSHTGHRAACVLPQLSFPFPLPVQRGATELFPLLLTKAGLGTPDLKKKNSYLKCVAFTCHFKSF